MSEERIECPRKENNSYVLHIKRPALVLLTSQLQVTTNHERNVRQKECPYYNQTSPRGTKRMSDERIECPRKENNSYYISNDQPSCHKEKCPRKKKNKHVRQKECPKNEMTSCNTKVFNRIFLRIADKTKDRWLWYLRDTKYCLGNMYPLPIGTDNVCFALTHLDWNQADSNNSFAFKQHCSSNVKCTALSSNANPTSYGTTQLYHIDQYPLSSAVTITVAAATISVQSTIFICIFTARSQIVIPTQSPYQRHLVCIQYAIATPSNN